MNRPEVSRSKYYPYPAHDNKHNTISSLAQEIKFIFVLRVIATSQFTKTRQEKKDV